MEYALVAMVEAQAGITALIGAGDDCRFYPEKLPQNPTYPAATYTLVSGPRDYTQQGPDGVTTFRYQISIYDVREEGAGAVRDAFEGALSGFYGQAFGSPAIHIHGVFVDNERSRFESQMAVTPPAPYRKILELAITAGRL